MKRRRFFESLTAALLAVLMITGGFALAGPPEGKGGGKGGGKTKLALTVTIDPASISERGEATGTVTHNNTDLSSAVTVSLASSDTTEATVAETVIIPSDSNSATFPIAGVSDSEADGDQTVTITATADGYESGAANLIIKDEVSLPPVEYHATYIPMPIWTNNFTLNDFSDSGMAVGFYINDLNEKNAWLYDPYTDPTQVVDLNTLLITGLDRWSTELYPSWTIASAVGINNNGLVVGYVRPIDDPTYRRGYVLDLQTMKIYDLPDGDLLDTYARKVNDNGDILGQFRDGDFHGAYLFNPGLRSQIEPDLNLEIVPTNVRSQAVALNNPPEGVRSEIVGVLATNWAVFQFTRGDTEAVIRTDIPLNSAVVINSFGDIAGIGSVTVELKGNKTATEYFVWRGTDTELETFTHDPYYQGCYGLNDFGTVLTARPGDHRIYHDNYGFVNVNHLIVGGIYPLGSGNAVMNNYDLGPLGFSEIAGVIPETGEFYILTPVATP